MEEMDIDQTLQITKHYKYDTPVDNINIINVDSVYIGSKMISKVKAFQYAPGIWYVPEYNHVSSDNQKPYYPFPTVLDSKYSLDEKLTIMSILMERIASTKQGQTLLSMIAKAPPIDSGSNQNLYSMTGNTISTTKKETNKHSKLFFPLHVLITSIMGYQHNIVTNHSFRLPTSVTRFKLDDTLLNAKHPTIAFSFDIILSYFNNKSIEAMDPALVLYHELVHCLHNIYDVRNTITVKEGAREFSCEEYMTYGGSDIPKATDKMKDEFSKFITKVRERYFKTAELLNTFSYEPEDKQKIAFKYDFILDEKTQKYIATEENFNKFKELLFFTCNETNFASELGISNRKEYYGELLPKFYADLTNPNIYSAQNGFKGGQNIFVNDNFQLHPNTIYYPESNNIVKPYLKKKTGILGKKITSLSNLQQKITLCKDWNLDKDSITQATKSNDPKINFPTFTIQHTIKTYPLNIYDVLQIDVAEDSIKTITYELKQPDIEKLILYDNVLNGKIFTHTDYNAPIDGKNIIEVRRNIQKENNKAITVTHKMFQVYNGIWINPDLYNGLMLDHTWINATYCSTKEKKSKYLSDMSILFNRIALNPVGRILLDMIAAGVPIPLSGNDSYNYNNISVDTNGKPHLNNIEIVPTTESYYPLLRDFEGGTPDYLGSKSSSISFNPDYTYLQYLSDFSQNFVDPAQILFNHLLISAYEIYGLYDSKFSIPNSKKMDIYHYLACGRYKENPLEKHMPQYIEHIKDKYKKTVNVLNENPKLKEGLENFRLKYFMPMHEDKVIFEQEAFNDFINLFTQYVNESEFNKHAGNKTSAYSTALTIPLQLDIGDIETYDKAKGIVNIDRAIPIYREQFTDKFIQEQIQKYYSCIGKRDIPFNLDEDYIPLEEYSGDRTMISEIGHHGNRSKDAAKVRVKRDRACQNIKELFEKFTTYSNKLIMLTRQLNNDSIKDTKKISRIDNNILDTYGDLSFKLPTTPTELTSKTKVDTYTLSKLSGGYTIEPLILKTSEDKSFNDAFRINSNLPEDQLVHFLDFSNKDNFSKNIEIAKKSGNHMLSLNKTLLNFGKDLANPKSKLSRIDDGLGFVNYVNTLLDNYYDEERHLKFDSAFSHGLHNARDILSIIPHSSIQLLNIGVDIYDENYKQVALSLGILLLLYCVPELAIVFTIYELFSTIQAKKEQRKNVQASIRNAIFLKLYEYNDYIDQSITENRHTLTKVFKKNFFNMIKMSVSAKANELRAIENNILYLASKNLESYDEMEKVYNAINKSMKEADVFLQDYRKNEIDRWAGELKHALTKEFVSLNVSTTDFLNKNIEEFIDDLVDGNMNYVNSEYITTLKREVHQYLEQHNIKNKLDAQIKTLSNTLDHIVHNSNFEYMPVSEVAVNDKKIYDKQKNSDINSTKVNVLSNPDYDYELEFGKLSSLTIDPKTSSYNHNATICFKYKVIKLGENNEAFSVRNYVTESQLHNTVSVKHENNTPFPVWKHVCISWNKDQLFCYIDGILYTQETKDVIGNTKAIEIVGLADQLSIADIIVYTRYKSEKEVRELYKDSFPNNYMYDNTRAPLRFNKNYNIKNSLYPAHMLSEQNHYLQSNITPPNMPDNTLKLLMNSFNATGIELKSNNTAASKIIYANEYCHSEDPYKDYILFTKVVNHILFDKDQDKIYYDLLKKEKRPKQNISASIIRAENIWLVVRNPLVNNKVVKKKFEISFLLKRYQRYNSIYMSFRCMINMPNAEAYFIWIHKDHDQKMSIYCNGVRQDIFCENNVVQANYMKMFEPLNLIKNHTFNDPFRGSVHPYVGTKKYELLGLKLTGDIGTQLSAFDYLQHQQENLATNLTVRFLPAGHIKYDDQNLKNLEEKAHNSPEEEKKAYLDYIKFLEQEHLCEKGNKEACDYVKSIENKSPILPNDMKDAKDGDIGAKLRLIAYNKNLAEKNNDGRAFRYFDREYRKTRLKIKSIVDRNSSVFNIKDTGRDYIVSTIPVCMINQTNQALSEDAKFDALQPQSSLIRLFHIKNKRIGILMSKDNTITGLLQAGAERNCLPGKAGFGSVFNSDLKHPNRIKLNNNDDFKYYDIRHLTHFSPDKQVIRNIPSSVWLPNLPLIAEKTKHFYNNAKYQFEFFSIDRLK